VTSGRRARKRGGKGGRQSRHHEPPLREFNSKVYVPRDEVSYARNKAQAANVLDEHFRKRTGQELEEKEAQRTAAREARLRGQPN
jgi:hypothetical protein